VVVATVVLCPAMPACPSAWRCAWRVNQNPGFHFAHYQASNLAGSAGPAAAITIIRSRRRGVERSLGKWALLIDRELLAFPSRGRVS